MAKKIVKKQKIAKNAKTSAEKSYNKDKANESNKQKGNEKNNSLLKNFFTIAVFLIITIAFAYLISMLFSSLSNNELPESKTTEMKSSLPKLDLPVTREYDITKVDLFSLPEWNAYQVTVKGVSLGDSIETVEEKLGKPDNIKVHKENIATLEYNENFEYEEKEDAESKGTALQFFMVNNQVRRMIVRQAFNDHLLGKTKIGYDLRKTYDTFGVPDQQEDVAPVRIFEYHGKGLELYIRRKEMTAFAFVIPGINGGQDEEVIPQSS